MLVESCNFHPFGGVTSAMFKLAPEFPRLICRFSRSCGGARRVDIELLHSLRFGDFGVELIEPQAHFLIPAGDYRHHDEFGFGVIFLLPLDQFVIVLGEILGEVFAAGVVASAANALRPFIQS
jgi:hypothetical protein